MVMETNKLLMEKRRNGFASWVDGAGRNFVGFHIARAVYSLAGMAIIKTVKAAPYLSRKNKYHFLQIVAGGWLAYFLLHIE